MIELKRDATANVVLNNLYKHTPLQTSFGVNMVALVDGVPRTLNLAQMLTAYVDHQVEVVTRRSEYRLRKAADRAHIVEGLLKALDMIDAIIALIRASDDKAAARDGLMAEPFEFSEVQAEHILDMTAVPPHPPGPVRPRGGDGQAAGDDRRAGGHPGRPRPRCARSSRTSWARSGPSTPSPAGPRSPSTRATSTASTSSRTRTSSSP